MKYSLSCYVTGSRSHIPTEWFRRQSEIGGPGLILQPRAKLVKLPRVLTGHDVTMGPNQQKSSNGFVMLDGKQIVPLFGWKNVSGFAWVR